MSHSSTVAPIFLRWSAAHFTIITTSGLRSSSPDTEGILTASFNVSMNFFLLLSIYLFTEQIFKYIMVPETGTYHHIADNYPKAK